VDEPVWAGTVEGSDRFSKRSPRHAILIDSHLVWATQSQDHNEFVIYIGCPPVRRPTHLAAAPPSIGKAAPLMNDAAGLQSHTMLSATSSGRARRAIGEVSS